MTPEELDALVRQRLADAEEMLATLDPAMRQLFEQQIRSVLAGPLGQHPLVQAAATTAVQTGDKYLTYRGDIKAALGLGGSLAFVTVHPEGHPAALYRLDADRLTLTADPLPCGGIAGLSALYYLLRSPGPDSMAEVENKSLVEVPEVSVMPVPLPSGGAVVGAWGF